MSIKNVRKELGVHLETDSIIFLLVQRGVGQASELRERPVKELLELYNDLDALPPEILIANHQTAITDAAISLQFYRQMRESEKAFLNMSDE